MQKYNDSVIDNDGSPVSGATVNVYKTGTTTSVTIYSDNSGTEKDNPFITGSDGLMAFYVPNGTYDITVSRTGYTSKTYTETFYDSNEYYADANVTDHGSSTTGSIYDLIDSIGSEVATIILDNSGGSTNTDYAITTALSIPSNVTLKCKSGARMAPTNCAITIAGQLVADTQCFSLSGTASVTFTYGSGIEGVRVEWFGSDGTALQNALNAAASGYFDILLGNTTIDIGTDTITANNSYSTLRGSSRWRSRISGTTGSFRFGNADNCRDFALDNLLITTSGSSNKTVDFALNASDQGAQEATIRDCRITGGKYALYGDGLTQLNIENSSILNSAADEYAMYITNTSFFNSLNITNSRFEGNVYIKMSRQLTINGTIFESAYGTYNVQIDEVDGGSIFGSYFESDEQICLYLGSSTRGVSVFGNMLDSGGGNTNHFYDDGQANMNFCNRFNSIGSESQIILGSNSNYCYVGPNTDAGGGEGIPKVTNNGTNNFVWGGTQQKFWISAQELVNTGSLTLTKGRGMPYWDCVDGSDSYFEYFFKIPDQVVYMNGTGYSRIYIDIYYAGSAADAGATAVFSYRTNPCSEDEAVWQDLTVTSNSDAGIVTTLSKITGQLDISNTDDFCQIRIGRISSDGSDNYTGSIKIFGMEIRVRDTLGFVRQ